ncbi:MAG: hypothetical protein ACLRWF_02375 [Ruthenibacterium sp.]
MLSTNTQCARRRRKKPTIFWPGSVSIPKGDGVRGYMVYEDGVFT